jgi:type IV secretory pathway TraG/TraD family ATPase VirD4
MGPGSDRLCDRAHHRLGRDAIDCVAAGLSAGTRSAWFWLYGLRVYAPPSFFWWWFSFDAYAPHIFVEGAYIAASGGFAAVAVAIGMSVWRAREAKTAETYGSARWANASEVQSAGLLGSDGHVNSDGTTKPTPLPDLVGAKHSTCSRPPWRR